MQYGFFFDQSRCIGCNACTVACKDWNNINPGPVRWRKQQNYETRKDGTSVFENLSMSCNHCEKPACIEACNSTGVSAIHKTAEGIVLVDRSKCQGFGECIAACPFSAPHRAVANEHEPDNDAAQEPVKNSSWAVEHPMQKCKYYYERVVQNGESPVCVAACPTHALDYGDIADLQKRHRDAVRLNPKDFPYAYKDPKNAKDTKPCLFIKKRTQPLAIAKLKK